jgi:hypothetical protein
MGDSTTHLGEASGPENVDTIAPAKERCVARAARIVDWLVRIRSEYLEAPGLRLTLREAERFWGLDAHVCEALLEALVAAGFLTRSMQGQYMRAGVSR